MEIHKSSSFKLVKNFCAVECAKPNFSSPVHPIAFECRVIKLKKDEREDLVVDAKCSSTVQPNTALKCTLKRHTFHKRTSCTIASPLNRGRNRSLGYHFISPRLIWALFGCFSCCLALALALFFFFFFSSRLLLLGSSQQKHLHTTSQTTAFRRLITPPAAAAAAADATAVLS